MKTTIAFLVMASAVSPIEKTVQLLTELQAKVVKDGEAEQKAYEEFTEYCEDTSKDTQFAIKTANGAKERSEAAIDQNSATISSASSKIEELAGSIGTSEKDLKAATEIRTKEAADAAKLDADLAETIDMLDRAVGIIEREMSKSAFVQTGGSQKIADALQAVLNAASVNAADKAKVQALLQSQSEDEDMQPAGAPDPAAYKSQSGGILSTLEDMADKAKAERADAQKAEMNAAFDFKLLKQKLEDSAAAQTKEMNGHKKAKSEAEEAKATAEGELEATLADIKDGSKKLKDLQTECMDRATSYEESQHERNNELEALGKAKAILEEKTGGAAERTYSFVQLKTKSRVHAEDAKDRVVALVQRIAKEQGATELSMLASRIQTVSGADPFGKVKGMIQEMIEKLVAEAQKEASHKAFCDKEMSETKAKREDKEGEVDDLNTKIDKATAKIAKLNEDVATLTTELAAIAKAQAKADQVRADEKAAWKAAKADFESGVEGVGMALQVLRDYYAEKDEGESFVQTQHDKATGAASGIIGMLEVIESDFSRMLADGSAAEDAAQKAYDQFTQDNEVDTAAKTTEKKFKEKASKETEATLAGHKEDLSTAQTELDAIMDYWEKLQPMCVAKPEPYAERKRRREAEIAGLKEGLRILEEVSAEEGGTAFLQIRRA